MSATAPRAAKTTPARLSTVAGRLTVANVMGAATGLLTGPLLARALGAHGRGDLAAVLVPLALAPYILNLGLPAFAARELARGRALRDVVGSAGLPLLAAGAIGACIAFPLATAFADGRETVRVLLVVVLLTLPVALIGNLVSACLGGLQRWGRMIWSRALAFGVPFAGIVLLFALDRLTVATAAIAAMLGALLSLLPAAGVVGEGGRPVFKAPLAREGLVFGLKSWVGGLAAIANTRLDQLVMITAVAPRELGLYAVAATLAGAPGLATGAVTPPLMTRISAGHADLLPRALRIMLAISVLINSTLAVAAPFLLPLLFGHDFRDAVPMAIVLLTAGVPYAGVNILACGLQADGAPGVPSAGEGIALAITVIGLALLLGPLGGLGAAVVSLVAYTASFVFQLVMARRRIAAPLSAYLVPSRSDLRWARGLRR